MSNLNIEHEWDENGECRMAVSENTPNWAWRWRDIVGIFFTTLAGYCGITSQALNGIAKECFAASEHSRLLEAQEREEFKAECARAEMAGALEGMYYFDGEPDA